MDSRRVCVLSTPDCLRVLLVAVAGLLCPVLNAAVTNRDFASINQDSQSVRGTLIDANGPIREAEVWLQSLKDEACAKTFQTKPQNAKEAEAIKVQLSQCAKDLVPTKTNERGEFAFLNLPFGWYAVRFLWNMDNKTLPLTQTFERSQFLVISYPYKDRTGRFDSIAQGRPFYLAKNQPADILFDNSAANALKEGKPKPPDQNLKRTMLMVSVAAGLAGSGLYKEAVPKFEEGLSEIEYFDYPQGMKWLAYDAYGVALLGAGKPEVATVVLTHAAKLSKDLEAKDSEKSILHLSCALSGAKNPDDCFKKFEALLSSKKPDPGKMLVVGSAYRLATSYEKAREIYDRIIAASPNNINVYKNLGNLYLDQGEIEKSIGYYEKYAEISKDKPEIAKNFLLVGFAYHKMKQYEKALDFYGRALQLTPNDPLAYTDIGWSRLEMGQTDAATQAFEKALSLKPSPAIDNYARQGLQRASSKK